MNRFQQGAGYAFAGFGLIFKPGIRLFVLVPLLVNILVFIAGVTLIIGQLQALSGWMLSTLPAWLFWLEWLIWPFAIISVLCLVYFGFTLLANLIAAPFNSLLSERIEAYLTGQSLPPFPGWNSLPSTIRRTVWSEIRKLLYQLKWLILLVFLSIIPGLNLLAPFAWLYFGAWVLSIEYAEYPMGNHGMYFAQVKYALKGDRMTALGFGGALSLITLVPVLNFLAMPVGVAGGTIYWVNSGGAIHAGALESDARNNQEKIDVP